MLVPADFVSGFAFKHGPAEVSAGLVAPEEFGTAGQISVAAQGIRALIMQAAPSATNTGQIRHVVLLVLVAVSRRRD
jgi:hypothetical protein